MNKEPIPGDCWETHSYDGVFTIDLPMGVRPKQENDGTTLVFTLPTSPRTEVVIGVFPMPDGEPLSQLLLRSELERFMTQCVGANKSTFETPADFDKEGFLAYQAVSQSDTDRWWIARAYGRRGGKSFLLVHWVGSEHDIKTFPLQVLTSINPILHETEITS